MPLFDTHAHLTDAKLADQLEAVMERAAAVGVMRVLTIGVNRADSEAAVAVAERFPDRVRAAVGIHPHDAAKVEAGDLERVRALLDHPLVVAVGEIGLDYHYDFAPRPVQQSVFAAQLAIAREADVPVVVHSREAMADTVRVLQEGEMTHRPVVFHCYGGTAEELAVLQSAGWWGSFTGVVTFKKAEALRAMARSYPADQVMIETDAPYLAPVPHRGQTNEPALLAPIATFMAELRDEPADALAEQTWANSCRFFGWPG